MGVIKKIREVHYKVMHNAEPKNKSTVLDRNKFFGVYKGPIYNLVSIKIWKSTLN